MKGKDVIRLVAISSLLLGLPAIGASADPTAGTSARETPTEDETPELAAVSEDPYTNPNTYHRTQVEPQSAAFGSTIVSVFQTGRSVEWGASNAGWSASTDAGVTWTDGFLPGTTTYATPRGRWARVTYPVVDYDAKHDTWLIIGLGTIRLDGHRGRAFVSISTDGAQTFSEPFVIARARHKRSFLLPWIDCDNFPTSPFYGNCYAAWSVFTPHDVRFRAYTSSDGGVTWTKASVPEGHCPFQAIPVVQPNGTVVIPFSDHCRLSAHTFISTDGGASYTGPFEIETGVDGRFAKGGLRATNVHSVDVDATGRLYRVWADCGFRPPPTEERICGTHNDIVLSTSEDGHEWTEMVRIPIDPVTSSVDHFLPAIAVDPRTAGATAHIAIVYLFHPKWHCDADTCELYVGLVTSTDGGSTWNIRTLAGPLKHTWFPLSGGYMVGEYLGVSFVDGNAIPVFPVAAKGRCKLEAVGSCNVWTAAATIPLAGR